MKCISSILFHGYRINPFFPGGEADMQQAMQDIRILHCDAMAHDMTRGGRDG